MKPTAPTWSGTRLLVGQQRKTNETSTRRNSGVRGTVNLAAQAGRGGDLRPDMGNDLQPGRVTTESQDSLYQAIADKLHLHFNGVMEAAGRSLVFYTIKAGPAKGHTLSVDTSKATVTLEVVCDLVMAKTLRCESITT